MDFGKHRIVAGQDAALEVSLLPREIAHSACLPAGGRLLGDLAGASHFHKQFVERRDIVVALDHGRDPAETLEGLDIEIPDILAHGMVVGVDDMGAHMAVAGHVELHHAVSRNAVEEGHGIIAMVEGADIDVVDVEQQPAAGAARQFGEEFPLGHLGIVELDIGRDVLQHDGAAEKSCTS